MVPRPRDEMKRILRSDWLPALVPQENFSFWPCKTSFIDQARSVFFGFLLTSTSSRQIKSQKRTCPISSHLYRLCFVLRCIWGQFPSTSPRGAYIWRGDLTEGFLRYEFGGGGGLYLEGHIHERACFRNFTLFCTMNQECSTLRYLTLIKGIWSVAFKLTFLPIFRTFYISLH